MNSTARGSSRLLHELQQHVTDLLRLLLLYPMAGAVHQMNAEHLCARALLHRFINARTLIGAPVLLSRDEARGHVDCAAGMSLQFGGERARNAAAIPLQAALESGARIFGALERKFPVGQPLVGGDELR